MPTILWRKLADDRIGIGRHFRRPTTNQEEFPNFDVKVINVFVPYLGAAPIEAEKAVCVRIEEAIEGVEGIEKVYGTAVEGGCSVASQLYSDADDISASNEIKSRIDSINNLPIETEKPNVSKVAFTRRVLQIACSGTQRNAN